MQLERTRDFILGNGDRISTMGTTSINMYHNTKKEIGEMTKAVKSLSNTTAPHLASLISKVDLLVKSRSHDTLERKVEELSGQMVSPAQRSRQQQELLDRVLEKVSAPGPLHSKSQPPLGPGPQPLAPLPPQQ